MNLPGFEIIGKVGEDRLTTVWKAKQISLSRTVCLKILRPEFASDAAQVEAFLSEGKRIAQLAHAGIVQVYNVFEHEGTHYLVIEHFPGSPLSKVLDREGSLPLKKALKVARQIAETMQHAWDSKRLIHRNLKPENIFVNDDNNVRVSFFGHCKVANKPTDADPDHEDQTIVGTPYYMAPEQAQCKPDLDCRADIYSLGANLYHMLTGKTPFEESDPITAADQQIAEQIPHPKTLNPTLPRSVGLLIERMMIKDRDQRPRRWEEIVQDLRQILTGPPPVKPLPPAAVSTVMSDPSVPTPMLRPWNTPPPPAQRGLYIPLWIQLPMWGLLLLLWYQLGLFMLDFWKQL